MPRLVLPLVSLASILKCEAEKSEKPRLPPDAEKKAKEWDDVLHGTRPGGAPA